MHGSEYDRDARKMCNQSVHSDRYLSDEAVENTRAGGANSIVDANATPEREGGSPSGGKVACGCHAAIAEGVGWNVCPDGSEADGSAAVAISGSGTAD